MALGTELQGRPATCHSSALCAVGLDATWPRQGALLGQLALSPKLTAWHIAGGSPTVWDPGVLPEACSPLLKDRDLRQGRGG